jgi:DinB superfamily
MPGKQIPQLIALLDEAYGGPAWHGPCLRGSLRGVTAREATWRPAPGRHNIWELVVHAAYWKYAVRRRLLEEKRSSFGEKGSNWFERASAAGEETNEAANAVAWRRDLALLARMQKQLREAVLALDEATLDRRCRGSRHTPRRMIAGTAMHDVYHAGQIQLLKRLARQSGA